MNLTDAQKKLIYILLTTLSGPLIAALTKYLHLDNEEVQLWTSILAVITTSIGSAWGITSFNATGVVQAAASLSPAQVQKALKQVPDTAKVLIANAVPGVATVVLKDSVTDGLAKLATDPAQENIVTETQNAKNVIEATK